MIDFVAHERGGDAGFIRPGGVAAPGRTYRDEALAVFRGVFLQHDGARQLPVFNAANSFLYGGELLVVGSSGEDFATMFGEPSEDSRDLRRGLPFSENHFRHAGAQGAVMIDLRE